MITVILDLIIALIEYVILFAIIFLFFLIIYYRFYKYTKVLPSSRLTGEEAARKMLNYCGINDVKIECICYSSGGNHYDTNNKTIRLSEDVFYGMNIYAVSVACHEVGHAIQHAESYAPLKLDIILALVFKVIRYLFFLVMLFSLILLSFQIIIYFLIIFACLIIIFSLMILLIEYNASSRVKKLAYEVGIVHSHEEIKMISKVLNTAFMTYIFDAFIKVCSYIKL